MHKLYNRIRDVCVANLLFSAHPYLNLIFTTIQVTTVHHEEYSQAPINSFQV